jgi:hypothetical protein
MVLEIKVVKGENFTISRFYNINNYGRRFLPEILLQMKNDKRSFLLYFGFCSLRFKVLNILAIFELFIDILILRVFCCNSVKYIHKNLKLVLFTYIIYLDMITFSKHLSDF